jgi:hypothetical protein
LGKIKRAESESQLQCGHHQIAQGCLRYVGITRLSSGESPQTDLLSTITSMGTILPIGWSTVQWNKAAQLTPLGTWHRIASPFLSKIQENQACGVFKRCDALSQK